jgi:hypothetical protein
LWWSPTRPNSVRIQYIPDVMGQSMYKRWCTDVTENGHSRCLVSFINGWMPSYNHFLVIGKDSSSARARLSGPCPFCIEYRTSRLTRKKRKRVLIQMKSVESNQLLTSRTMFDTVVRVENQTSEDPLEDLRRDPHYFCACGHFK